MKSTPLAVARFSTEMVTKRPAGGNYVSDGFQGMVNLRVCLVNEDGFEGGLDAYAWSVGDPVTYMVW